MNTSPRCVLAGEIPGVGTTQRQIDLKCVGVCVCMGVVVVVCNIVIVVVLSFTPPSVTRNCPLWLNAHFFF